MLYEYATIFISFVLVSQRTETVEAKKIWVLPELSGDPEKVTRFSYGLLTEARDIADRVSGEVTVLVLGEQVPDYSAILREYGADKAYSFQHPALRRFSAETYCAVLGDRVRQERPWLILMGDTMVGRELAPRLAVLLDTGLVTNCVKMDLSDPETPKFFRPVYHEQWHQEIIFQTGNAMLVTMPPSILNVAPRPSTSPPAIFVTKPELSSVAARIEHLEVLPSDFRTADVSDADVIVAAGLGVAADDLLPLVAELAELLGASIGATRPVVDEGKLPRDRMVGQTGKVVSPNLYLALGISGASHHVAGIQDSGTIVSVNSDPQAPIFQNSDVGAMADLRDVLPRIIDKIRQAKKNGTIL